MFWENESYWVYENLTFEPEISGDQNTKSHLYLDVPD